MPVTRAPHDSSQFCHFTKDVDTFRMQIYHITLHVLSKHILKMFEYVLDDFDLFVIFEATHTRNEKRHL